LWAAAAYKIPFLTIVFNNGQYTAPKLALRWAMGKESYSDTVGPWVGTDITPSPDYAAIARACHCHGQTVTEPAEIRHALKTALAQVRGGTPAVLDIRVAGL
jgi:acetolactate synthase-1/2/3 large subunit